MHTLCESSHRLTHYKYAKNLCGLVDNILECYIVISKFKIQSCYYIFFRTNTLGKGMISLIPLSMG